MVLRRTMMDVCVRAPVRRNHENRRHRVVDAFVARGDVIGIGPFADRGNMAIFRTRAAAEAFVAQDPFVLEGLVKSVVIREWHDTMLT
jgi:uncharacterized protein